jgi:YHS domain-containing protein
MAKVKDPVCDMELESHEAVGTYEFEGTTYYFCAPNCLDAFVANPSRYVGNTALTDREVPLEKHEPRFTKEGFPAPKFGSAGSGGAEFEPGPERHLGEN